MGTKASGSGALGRLIWVFPPPFRPLAGRVLGAREHGRLGRHVRSLVGQQRRRQRRRLDDRVLGGRIHGLVEIGLGGGLLDRLDVEDVAEIVVVDHLHQLAEHGVALLLPRVEGVGLDRPAQVDTVLEVVHLGQVVAPARVHDLQVDVAFDLAHGLGSTGHRLAVLLVVVERLLDDGLDQVLGRGRLLEVGHGELGRVVLRQRVDQALEVPVLLELGRAVLGDQLLRRARQQILGVLLEVVAVDDLQAAFVDRPCAAGPSPRRT